MRGLKLDDISMSFGRRVLFQGITVSLSSGQALAVTGSNGTGKSTLLRIICGLMRPDSGDVHHEVDGGTSGIVFRNSVGYVSPDINLYSELTGDENMKFFAGVRGSRLSDASELVSHVGLTSEAICLPVSSYSSGLRQRLKLAVSLIGKPSLLVWDEPTIALDRLGIAMVDNVIARHIHAGGIAVLATNDSDEADRWADSRLNLG